MVTTAQIVSTIALENAFQIGSRHFKIRQRMSKDL